MVVQGAPSNCQTVNGSDPTKCDLCLNGFYPQQDFTGCSNSLSQCILYSGNNCIKCNSSFGVYDNTCVSNISYCAFYFSLSKCKSCHTELGYSINELGTQCFNTINNCLVYSSSSLCKQCKPGYSLASDNSNCYLAPTSDCFQVNSSDKYTCASCNKSYYLTSQKTCEICNIPNCALCNSSGICTQCINSAFVISNGNCICNKGFYQQISYNTLDSPFLCQQCQSKCETCSTLDSCTTCKGNRRIELNCECPLGYIDDFKTGECHRCQQGQYQYGYQCVSNCPQGYYKNKKTRQCTLCSQADKSIDQCQNFVTASLKYSTNSKVNLILSESVKVAPSVTKLEDCFNILIVNESSSSNSNNISISKVDDTQFEISLQQSQTYSETILQIESIEQGCFQKADSSLIEYPISISPNSIFISPEEDLIPDTDSYDKAIRVTVYILGAFTIITNFFGIKISQSILIETLQIVYCLFFLDLYMPFHLISLFKAADIYNFRILNYILSGFNDWDLNKNDLLFNKYKLKDQDLAGRFYQRGFQVSNFFYNGLTYAFLIFLFYGIYLFLTKTFLAPYDVPLAKPQKQLNDSSEKRKKSEEQNNSQGTDLISKSPLTKTGEPSVQTQQIQQLVTQKSDGKIYEQSKYQNLNFHLLQIVMNMIRISYIPLAFTAGLQIRSYSQADSVNVLSFFCAILALILISYANGILMYRDIKKLTINFPVRKEDQKEYIFQVSELNITNSIPKMSKMEFVKAFYPIIQTYSFTISVLLITWLEDNTDILLYFLIVLHFFLLAITLYSPFVTIKANLIHLISLVFVLLMLIGLLTMRNLNKQIIDEVSLNKMEEFFNGVQYVALFLVGIFLLYIILSFLYQSFTSYHFIKNGFQLQNQAIIYPLNSPTKNPVITIENLEDKPGQDISNKASSKAQTNDSNDRKKPQVDTKQNRRLSLLNQMQAYQSSSSQKQIFVAPRQSLSYLKQNDIQPTMTSMNEQISTNPGSIQVIELQDIQKLVKENKKMEQKLNVIEKKQQQIIKQIQQQPVENKQNSKQQSLQSFESENQSDEENPKKKKQSQNQSINTIEEEDELTNQNEVGQRRQRRGLIPQTPPSLERIQRMNSEVFHFGDDIKVDTNTNKRDKERKKSQLQDQKLIKRKSKTMVLDEDTRGIFAYNENSQNSTKKMLNKIQFPEKENESSSEDENDLNFWKNSRKQMLKQDKESKVKSMVIKND